jgi:hypothetical protein
MSTSTAEPSVLQTLEVTKHIEINAPIDIVFETILEQIGPLNETCEGVPLPMKLEAWPGGRWFREFDETGGGAFWGHVQTIRPHDLLEIHGPLFMSSPAISYVVYKLKRQGNVTLIDFAHRAIGEIPPHLSDGVAVTRGWTKQIHRIRDASERRRTK